MAGTKRMQYKHSMVSTTYRSITKELNAGQYYGARQLPNEDSTKQMRLFSAHRIPAPILTRWWTVGECAANLLKHMTILLALCHGVIQASATAHAVNQVASRLQALLKMPQILVSDISLIDANHEYFLCSHFAWLQKGDLELGNKPGFINRHITIQYFSMHEEF
jgi:hypothetical protein